jgi:protein kinase-like protein
VPVWARIIVAIAALRTGTALAVYWSGPSPLQWKVPPWAYAGLALTFLALGLALAVGNRRDARAAWLGALFTVISSSLVTALIGTRARRIVPALIDLRPEAFTGAFLWYFLARFPSDLDRRRSRVVQAAAAAAAAVGAACMAANIAAPWIAAPPRWLVVLLPATGGRSGGYWLIVFGLAASALPALLWRARIAAGDARARVAIFIRGLLAGFAPFAVEVIVEELVPPYKAFVHQPNVEPWIGAVLFGALAIVPAVTTYSVLYDRVVDVRIVLRAALQYVFARYTIVAATLLPFAALAIFLFEHRQESLAAIVSSGPRPLLLGGSVAFGLAALRLRARWLAALDRRYFRESYDPQQTLTRFVAGLPDVTPEEIAARIQREVGRALHAGCEVFLADEARVAMRHVGDRLPPVALAATLTDLALGDSRPMDVDLHDALSPLRRLPPVERRWLETGGFNLIVALRRGSGGAAGLLALTPKRSGLQYSNDDRRLLSAVASAASLALDSLRLRSTPDAPSQPPARECLECSRLSAADTSRCACGGDVVSAAVPHVLRGVFRFEQRIGAGGMGVVYRAIDLNLNRDVAIKALPRATPQHVQRLRREARAMAVISHPNLAAIHGIETWRETPFIVQEYVAGGTLAQRLGARRLRIEEVLDIGITLAEFLDHLHASGVVHCDIKPSNIGFTERGVLKVLDFGLARVLRELRVDSDGSTTEPRAGQEPAAGPPDPTANAFGTPHFMSPEAIRGLRPSPSFDLWALAIVLYEGIAGQRPFDGHDVASIHASVLSSTPPDIRLHRPDATPDLAEFVASSLASDPVQRPRDARAFIAHLRRLRAQLPLG